MINEELNGQLRLQEMDPLAGRSFSVRKRDGRLAPFDESRILIAVEAAFRALADIGDHAEMPSDDQAASTRIATLVIQDCVKTALDGDVLEIENIQDFVETRLMEGGYHGVARRFIIYREQRRKARALRGDKTLDGQPQAQIFVVFPDGHREPLDPQRIRRQMIRACRGFERECNWQEIAEETLRNLYDGVRIEEIRTAMTLAARSRIEKDPAYTYVAARILLGGLYDEVLNVDIVDPAFNRKHQEGFSEYVRQGVELKRLSPRLLEFDLERIAAALKPERDDRFTYLGAQTIYDRYLIHSDGRRLETPQYFWMRVAMGLSIGEKTDREGWAIRFYNLLSTFRFVSSTPTLFNSGTCHPQLSSCYLSTVMDDLEHIFKVISDDAKLSKWAGGLGNDWTNVRSTGAHIRGTNGTSQGVIPFLKVANDTAVAVNQGGKRKGAMCAYLETWHLDVEDFLELRKNTGDERRRTHDMNTANWVPDLFMKRVRAGAKWTLLDPSEAPDLHDLYGSAFEARYEEYERMADQGKLRNFKRVDAMQIWKKMLTMLFETGHPWITFKDPSNIRSPQSHTGVVHSSNLCTEILLNTSDEETAVCNLGSVNLPEHIDEGGLAVDKLRETVETAMRMLDNVIDINFYPTPEARNANLRHRPVGLGIMGFQDALFKLRIPYSSQDAVEFADESMEKISYFAISASAELAGERGAYTTFKGSKWDQGLLPIDTIDVLESARNEAVNMDRSMKMDWGPVREAIARHGMRNSNTMAIAPTATISNISGVSQSIEPIYKHLFVKSNLSGEFTVVNQYLAADLKERGMWDAEMVDDLKYFDGSVAEIDRIPEDLKWLYRSSFEIEPKWLIECASRRQKWIDMSQSLNLYMAEPSGPRLSDMYQLAWSMGLKTTYYLRSTAKTTVEKSTLDVNARGVQPRWMRNQSASSKIEVQREAKATPACRIDDPECESCQ